MRKVLCFLLSAILLYGSIPARGEERSSSLAILLYMTGSDLESRGGAGSDDLQEIMDCLPEGDDIRVIAMISGAKSWDLPVSVDETSIYEISHGNMTKQKTLPVQSMGDPDTLTSYNGPLVKTTHEKNIVNRVSHLKPEEAA